MAAPLLASSLSTTVKIVSMNGGLDHLVYADADGSVWDWGRNTSGQLGDGSVDSIGIPQKVDLPDTIKQVAAGQQFTLALSSDGDHVFAWGDNGKGELGIGTGATSETDLPVEVDLDLPINTTVTSIADGGNGGFAVLSTGQVMGWGANEHGQAGQDHHSKEIYTPAVVPDLSDVVSVAAGDHQTLALKSDGTVWAWGGNRYGQLGPNGPTPSLTALTDQPVEVTGLPRIVAIATGGEDSLALDAQGHIWSWGRNGFGELGSGKIDPNDGAHSKPRQIVGLSNVVSMDGEGPATLAADASGNVYAWGFNRQGEVGDGTATNTATPQLILSFTSPPGAPPPSVQVAAGHWFSAAFDPTTGQIFEWGSNQYGELGSPANSSLNNRPTEPGGLFGSIDHDPHGAAGHVYALYEAILGHAPDPLGLEQFSAELEAGAPLRSVAREILSSPEYESAHGSYLKISNDAFVTALYEADFHRTPQGHEADGWIAYLRNEASRAHVATETALPPEGSSGTFDAFATSISAPDADAPSFSPLFYSIFDPQGLDISETEVSAGTSFSRKGAARTHVATEIALSSEGRSNIIDAFKSGVFVPDANAASISRLYYGLLDRAPDAVGLGIYETEVAAGTSLRTIAADIIGSPEYIQLHGSQTNADFVQALFKGATGSPGTTADMHHPLHALDRGVARGAVAFQIAESPAATAYLTSQIEIGKVLT